MNWKKQIKQMETYYNSKQRENLTGMGALRQMGLVPADYTGDGLEPPPQLRPPNAAERKKLQGDRMGAMGDVTMQPQIEGKNVTDETRCDAHVCCMARKNTSTQQSGKHAKSMPNIKRQEIWPHTQVMKKYCKKVTFESMDFESFVAGETRIIYNMDNQQAATGRLRVLCRIAHWMCRSKDWPSIKNLYEGIIESVETEEADWWDDFSHYETLVGLATVEKNDQKPRDHKKDKDKQLEVYWCKHYQKGDM